MSRSFLLRPFALAALVTLVNVAKPVVVDDTAYLFFARQVAEQPFNPYGFSIFWWSSPEHAMGVLAPPVVPYWLAAGLKLFGESPVLLKLWLFPFVWLLAWSLRALLNRFARGVEEFALPLLMLSPAVLPTVNLMLDIPAVALVLTSVEVFIRASTRRGWLLAILAGVITGVAMQTKYTAFVAPAAIVWYGLTHRSFALAVVAAGIAVAIFAGWEFWLIEKYGQSHFLFHARGSVDLPPGTNRVREFLKWKGNLIFPLIGHAGCVAVGTGLWAASVLRVPRVWLAVAAAAWCVGFVLVCTLPHRWGEFTEEVTATAAFWQVSGCCVIAAIVGCTAMLLFRVKKGLAPRLNADAWFLAGWLVIEIVASIAMSPFPAARRVIGCTFVAALIVARATSRVQRADPARRAPQWIRAFAILIGVLVTAIDTFDAYPEKVCAEIAAEVTRDQPKTSAVWFVGHWGFQYYCERAGMKPLVPGETIVRAGDYVVLPVLPKRGFGRPDTSINVNEPSWEGEEVAIVQWDDWLSARTVPLFYGGGSPITGRDNPRLTVRVFRLRHDWVMPR